MHRYRNFPAQFRQGLVNANQPGFQVQGVLSGFQQQQVGAALHQPQRLLPIGGGQFVKSNAAGNGDGFGGRPHRPGHETRLFRSGNGGRRFPGQLRRYPVNAAGFPGQIILGQHHRSSAESVGLDHIGSGFQIRAMDVNDDFGPGQGQILVAALKLRPAKIRRAQVPPLNGRPHSPIKNDNPFPEQGFELSNAVRCSHKFPVAKNGKGWK